MAKRSLLSICPSYMYEYVYGERLLLFVYYGMGEPSLIVFTDT